MLLMLLLRSLLSINDSLFFLCPRIFLWVDRGEVTGIVGDISLPCENGYDLCMEDLAFCFCFFFVFLFFVILWFLPMVFGVLAGLTMSPVCFSSGVLEARIQSFCFMLF